MIQAVSSDQRLSDDDTCYGEIERKWRRCFSTRFSGTYSRMDVSGRFVCTSFSQ